MIDLRSLARNMGVHLSDETVFCLEGEAMEFANPLGCCRVDGGEGWYTWLKGKLKARKYFRAGMKSERDEVKLWVLLHVFPIHRDSVRLPNDNEDGLFCFRSDVARSDVIRGHLVPRPINKLAWRLARDAPPRRFDDLIREDDD